jgi:hypothetical protein
MFSLSAAAISPLTLSQKRDLSRECDPVGSVRVSFAEFDAEAELQFHAST